MKKRRRVMNKRRKNGAICKAPDAVLTRVSRFRDPLKLVAHKRPPTHDTHTRVAAGFSTTDIRTMNFILGHKYIEFRAYIAAGNLLHHLRGPWTQQYIMQQAEDNHD